MKRRVGTPQIKVNVLDEQRAKLTFLQSQSSNAVSVFTDAIQTMKVINTEIQMTHSEISATIADLKNTQDALLATECANSNLIAKFETLLA